MVFSQGSILGLLLFNIDIYDMFLSDSTCDIAGYADDYMPYTTDVSEDLVLNKLENSWHDLFKWFRENHLKVNSDKRHLLTSAVKTMKSNIFKIKIKLISIATVKKNCWG